MKIGMMAAVPEEIKTIHDDIYYYLNKDQSAQLVAHLLENTYLYVKNIYAYLRKKFWY